MSTIEYPASLPLMRLEGMQTQRKSNVVRTEMDAGPAKARRRYTVSSKYFTGTILLKSYERETFEAWYKHTLCDGILRFKMKDPQTLSYGEFRFSEDYTESNTDGLWQITMKLEKMNA
ncbi:hypothetical protein [Treponema pectinovorum]|uniref:hypothetical protein n=1 Tax=Treponema pectinovorum TaxID=164 RepID=UPI0011CB04FE|nr:hypothetical protein [Treponema pectinovorum]